MKWNKEICVEYITQVKNPLEEQANRGNGSTPETRWEVLKKELEGEKPQEVKGNG